jgi:hypothetical protein
MTPNGNLLTNGLWVASDLSDRLLVCGQGTEVWGDAITLPLAEVVADLRAEVGLDTEDDDSEPDYCSAVSGSHRHTYLCFHGENRF